MHCDGWHTGTHHLGLWIFTDKGNVFSASWIFDCLILLSKIIQQRSHCKSKWIATFNESWEQRQCLQISATSSHRQFICALSMFWLCEFTYYPPKPQACPLRYQIYCKAVLWESTHALPSPCTAPWQLPLYIPLQMRAENWRDYRVEQRQWGEEREGAKAGGRLGEKMRKKRRKRATSVTRGSDGGLL